MAGFVMWVLTALATIYLFIVREIANIEVPTWIFGTLIAISVLSLWLMCMRIHLQMYKYDNIYSDQISWVIAPIVSLIAGCYFKSHYDQSVAFLAIGVIAGMMSMGFLSFCTMLHKFHTRLGELLRCRKNLADYGEWLMIFTVTLAISTGLFYNPESHIFRWLVIGFTSLNFILLIRVFINYLTDLKFLEMVKRATI